HIAIGSHSIIKAKSGVSHSFPENSDLFGYPAKDTRAYYKNIAVLNILTKNHQFKKNRSISDTWRNRFFNFLNS
ncbi:UDP-3-O-(3-hydroxymyristoyl)glucosamine N-acyltransferase, partial [Klebsiella michiganensis]